ncbi:MAG: hypothetical protein KBB21_02000 [Nannocystaceae bacterium]|nr:hypothetical protein [Deltaproteobacteria bacterium]MBP7285353.1 hypothetical protein [Nannocystaceae bacterium]
MESSSLARRTARSWLLLAWALACTSSEQAATPAPATTPTKAAEPTKAVAPAAPVDGKAAEPTPAAPTPVPPTPAAPTPVPPTPVPSTPVLPVTGTDVAPPVGDPSATPDFAQAPMLATETITSTPTTVSWREVARPEASVELEPVTRGVLARSSLGFFDVDSNGALVLRKEIEAPKGPVLGIWPDNAWVIERRTREHKDDRSGDEDRQIRLVRLRGKKRWVPQEYHYEQRFDDRGEDFAMGAKIGMLVKHGCDAGYNDQGTPPADCNPNALTRVADSPEDPEMGASVGGELTGFFETRGGEIYTARVLNDAVYLQRDCADAACVAANVRRLPDGRWWSFERPIARQKHSVSVVATLAGTPARSHVLHYEASGWKLESLDAAPKGLWPLDDGGLWTQVGDTVLHRDPAGSWRTIELPDGASAPSIAVSGDGNEVWLAAQVGGTAVVFATPARAQQPAPTPTPAAP